MSKVRDIDRSVVLVIFSNLGQSHRRETDWCNVVLEFIRTRFKIEKKAKYDMKVVNSKMKMTVLNLSEIDTVF